MSRVIQGALVMVVVAAAYAVCRAVIVGTNPYVAAALLAVALYALADEHQTDYRLRLHLAGSRAAVWNRREMGL